MQSTRLLITAQRCSSASRINYLLKRCLALSNTTTTSKTNLNKWVIDQETKVDFCLCCSSVLSLVDSHPSLCPNGRLFSVSKSNLISVRYASTGSLPSHKRITLPALSPTMETGTLRSWAKSEGEKVAEGIRWFYIDSRRRKFVLIRWYSGWNWNWQGYLRIRIRWWRISGENYSPWR